MSDYISQAPGYSYITLKSTILIDPSLCPRPVALCPFCLVTTAMKSSTCSLLVLCGSISLLVSSSPTGNSPEGLAACAIPACAAVSDVLGIIHNPAVSATATKFCSYFISIPLQTATSITTATITPAPVDHHYHSCCVDVRIQAYSCIVLCSRMD